MDLKGQVAIVTGGGTGIGRAIALALVAQGARVVVVGRRLHPLQEVSEAIRANRGECLAVRSDVSKAADVAALVAAAEKRYGRVDILVNNAGSGGGGWGAGRSTCMTWTSGTGSWRSTCAGRF